MKKILSLILAIFMLLGLVACGSASGTAGGETEAPKAVFMAGFGMVDITPKDPVPLDSYGDARDRISTGMYSNLEARCVALQDPEGNMLLFIVGDLTYCSEKQGTRIRKDLSKEFGIPEMNIILSGTHTHSSVAIGLTDMPAVSKYNEQYISGMEEAARKAIEDLKPAQVYVGSIMTEGMNYVRRYYMDDGSLAGDGTYGTGTKRVEHESEADPELQLMKFVREGGKDILVAQFQSHPHLEGKSFNVSAQTIGATRDAVEAEMDVHCLAWNGAAGNINSQGSLEGESRFETSNAGRIAYGKEMCKYVKKAYDGLTKVNTGIIQVQEMSYTAKVNHTYDHMLSQAMDVQAYFNDGHTTNEATTYAQQYVDENGRRINTVYHANRIVANAKLGDTQEIALAAWSFGDVGGVVLPFEMFDTNGMQIKEGSPFERTFIVGYSYPAYHCYIPSALGYENGGYEVDNSTYAAGTAEGTVEAYLGMLKDMHG